jgi:hypothetical protein
LCHFLIASGATPRQPRNFVFLSSSFSSANPEGEGLVSQSVVV